MDYMSILILEFQGKEAECFLDKGLMSFFVYGLYFSSGRATMPAVEASSRVDRFSKDDIIVSPSILSANFARLGEQVWGQGGLFS